MFFVSLQYKLLSNTELLKSTSLPERIALIEFDSSHDECLLTQINALKKRGCWVVLVTNECIRKRNQHLEPLVNEWIDIDPRGVGLTGAAIGDALIIRLLMRKLKTEKIDRAIFNTAQGGHVRNACLFSLFRKIEFVGIIHTIRKFQGSFTQKIIHLKIKKYFVLGEFLLQSVLSTSLNQQTKTKLIERSRKQRSKLKIEPFYPLDFPNIPTDFELGDQTHISLIGTVENRRKDLDGFISLIQQCSPEVTFSFLGKADPSNTEVIEFKEKLAEINCLNRVEFFEKFISTETISRILRKSSAILPLVHPNTSSAKEYFRNQIPGAMTVALGYKIPLLLHESFRMIKELNPASVYYELDTFTASLNELRSTEKNIRKTVELTEKYTSEYQQNAFLKFVFT